MMMMIELIDLMRDVMGSLLFVGLCMDICIGQSGLREVEAPSWRWGIY
jgi:hypothetical protein